MGWASVGACVLAGGFLLYQHPPRTWNLSLSFRPPSPSNPASSKGRQDGKQEEVKTQTISLNDRPDSSNSTSPQITPKSSAVTQNLQQVPELSLDTTHSQAQNGTMISKSQEQNSASNDVSKLSKPIASATPPKNANLGPPSLMPPPPPRLTPPRSSIPRETPASQRLNPSNSGQFLVPPKPKSSTALRPPPSAAATLRGLPGAAPSQLTSSTLAPSARQSSRKVILEPGHSPLDWAALASDPRSNLRGANLPPTLIKVTPSMLKAHNGRKGMDAWTSYQGKVYNITPYIPFHPGGKGEILRGAGKDSAQLFLEVHPWVNWDGMLSECLVGILVSENEALSARSNDLDAMD